MLSTPPLAATRELTILMPCLNEAETLAVCIEKARRFLREQQIDGEVLIADNGSTDGSQQIAQAHGARVIDVPIRGYGAALGHGIHAAQGKFVIMGDADDSYDFSNLMPYVERLRAGDELVMGNRFRGGIAPGAMPFLHKYLGNPVLTFIGRLFFHSPARDFHCGLRGFQREAILGLDLRTTGMEFASEMVVKASLRKLRVSEVPTTLKKDGRSRPPHLRTWRDGWRHLRFLLMYSPRWLFVYPGLLLILLGTIGMLGILPGERRIGDVAFDVNTLLLSGVALILGTQQLLFALLAKQAATLHGLLPPDARLERFSNFFTLEKLVVLGALVFTAGLALTLRGVFIWRGEDYGALDISAMMRLIIPAAVAMVVGIQVAFGAFVSSILTLTVRK
ncbi:MAG: dolichol-P-glucose synthetase [Azospirillum brasilense]|nr:MAG: dolichol-P-glucose synthetase [Azospirillum brasilense]